MENGMTARQYFEQMLRSTGREGVEDVIVELDDLGFFEAPASTAFHLNVRGGLVQHSVNVCKEALVLREAQVGLNSEIADRLPKESVIIASLLHDVCKAEVYVPEIKSRKTIDGSWEKYRGYSVDYSGLPVGHGEKSVIRLLRWGFPLTDDELIAIRWHMQAWDLPFQSPEMKSNLNTAKENCPLLSLISAADGLASFLLEERNS